MKYEVELTYEQAREVEAVYRHDIAQTPTTAAIVALAAAIRANPPKPPRMAEPHWGRMVVAHTADNDLRRQFLRFLSAATAASAPWIDVTGESVPWDYLIDPEPAGGAS